MPVIPPRARLSSMNASDNGRAYKGLNPLQLKQTKKIAKTAANRKQEKKRFAMYGAVNTKLGNAYGVNALYGIVQGTNISQRIANSIYLDKIDMKFSFYISSATNTPVTLRFFMYWASDQTFTSTGNPTEVTNANIQSSFPLVGTTSAPTAVELQPLDWNQCTVVYDWLAPVPIYVTAQSNFVTLNKTFRFKGRKCQYLSDSNDFMEGKNLYFGWIADSATGTSGTTVLGQINYQALVTFRD